MSATAPSLGAQAARGEAAIKPVGRTGNVSYPRVFTGRHLAMLAFPLGGVGAGSISLGGRGNLRDWEIFNKPDKGNNPTYALPSIWVRAGNDNLSREC